MPENTRIVPATCTQCGGTVNVDPGSEKATCPFCGTSFIVEKAVNNYNVEHMTVEHADNVNIDMKGSVDSVLNFVGDQLKESRGDRRQARREAKEKDMMMTQSMFKMFGIVFAVMCAFGIIGFIVLQFTDPDKGSEGTATEYVYSQDRTLSCYIDSNGMLSINITDPGDYQWYFDDVNSTEIEAEYKADFDGYHFTIKPSGEYSEGYAIVYEYKDGDPDISSYGVVRIKMDFDEVTEISDVSHVTDLNEYDFSF